jgi:hypothetical protein
VPWQLFGYGRSDWSTKLIRGLTSEAAAGFRSRRGLSYDDSAPVTPHNAPFPTYKAAGSHVVMPGTRSSLRRLHKLVCVPGTHVFLCCGGKDVDGRTKSGHDGARDEH